MSVTWAASRSLLIDWNREKGARYELSEGEPPQEDRALALIGACTGPIRVLSSSFDNQLTLKHRPSDIPRHDARDFAPGTGPVRLDAARRCHRRQGQTILRLSFALVDDFAWH